MVISATEFKAKCLALIDRVNSKGESITITKRGRVVAKLVPERDLGDQPWRALRGAVRRYDDPFLPAVAGEDVDVFK
jgi:prevent-host-death family protein